VRTLKIVLAYEGTRYVGWQRQRNGVSVQGLVEEALAPLNGGRAVRVSGAGRTDAGVHALGQVASCRLASALDPSSLQRALNARLPADVRVLSVEDAAADFHARFWARSKTYAYHVLSAPVGDPLVRHIVWQVPQTLDAAAMTVALRAVRGRHDFRSFQAAGSRVTRTVRTIMTASLSVRSWTGMFGDGSPPDAVPSPARLLTVTIQGDGFLRHMVRNLVGTLVDVGIGRRPAEGMRDTLLAADRRLAGATAPAHGLVLMSVAHGAGPADHPADE
jgi:tRNA pseudouridine38-40 synthase